MTPELGKFLGGIEKQLGNNLSIISVEIEDGDHYCLIEYRPDDEDIVILKFLVYWSPEAEVISIGYMEKLLIHSDFYGWALDKVNQIHSFEGTLGRVSLHLLEEDAEAIGLALAASLPLPKQAFEGGRVSIMCRWFIKEQLERLATQALWICDELVYEAPEHLH